MPRLTRSSLGAIARHLAPPPLPEGAMGGSVVPIGKQLILHADCGQNRDRTNEYHEGDNRLNDDDLPKLIKLMLLKEASPWLNVKPFLHHCADVLTD
mmetsp:Transcript_108221/g.220967  ORF Transcript_108221/g.220967 Transcript_108221/m.220967 type:complete len:97 (+) Transcript_108221:197-487(+)